MTDMKMIKKVQDRVVSRLEKYKDEFRKDTGKNFERAMTDILRGYVMALSPEEKQAPETDMNDTDDFLRGTDLIINDPCCTLLSRRILRLDATLGLGSKDFMPLLTPPDGLPILLPNGQLQKVDKYTRQITNDPYNRGIVPIDANKYMRFGLRIGCGAHGFDEPVVVMGLYSDRDMGWEDAYDASLTLCSDVMKNAPAIISTANKVMSRYRYMTNEQYRKKMDKAFTPEQIMKRLPILVYNQKFAGSECRDFGYCKAAQIDPLGMVMVKNNNVVQKTTDVPWLSAEGRRAIEAMKQTPRAFRDGMLENIEKALSSPCREDGTEAPLIIDPNGKAVTGDNRPKSLQQLTKNLNKQFSHGKNQLDKKAGNNFQRY